MDIEEIKTLVQIRCSAVQQLSEVVETADELRKVSDEFYWAIHDMTNPRKIQEKWEKLLEIINRMLEKPLITAKTARTTEPAVQERIEKAVVKW
jgi:uncharacterized coiled-coil DUF342 family protein